jgi:hypothetical protein
MRLVDNQSLEKLAEEFDDDVRFINGIVDFLKGIRWIKKDRISGLHQITEIGRMKANALKPALKAHFDWHGMAAHAKLYYLPKSFLVRLLNELTNDELNELARDVAKNELVDVCLFLRGGFNIASISQIAETWLKVAQMSHRIEVDGNIYKIIIEHDMGRKYSYLIRDL